MYSIWCTSKTYKKPTVKIHLTLQLCTCIYAE